MDFRVIKKQGRIYTKPVLVMVLVVQIGALIIINFLGFFQSEVNIPLLVLESILSALVTFSAIFVSFMIERNHKKEDERRIFAFMLGSICSELRENLSLIRNAKNNFKFDAIYSLSPLNKMATVIANKYQVVSELIKSISKDSFLSAQGSSAIVTIDDDEIYNRIFQSYENLSILKTTNLVCEGNMNMAIFVSGMPNEQLTPFEESVLDGNLKELMNKVLLEMNFSENKVAESISQIENKLDKMGIKLTLEKRDIGDNFDQLDITIEQGKEILSTPL